jgi:hypothetical protein
MAGELVRFSEEVGHGAALPPVLAGSMTPAVGAVRKERGGNIADIAE